MDFLGCLFSHHSVLRVYYQLFANHDQIRRTVAEILGGIRSITESDNPQVAALIKEHVPRMYQRIENGQGIPMIMIEFHPPDNGSES